MIKVSNGNKKIGKDTLIINFNSATDCPSKALGLCTIEEGKCYALKAEKCYPQVLPYRRAQEEYWRFSSAIQVSGDLKDIISRKKNTINYIRFSEAGDFATQDDVERLKDIASLMGEVIIYGYTARRDLTYIDIPSNLIINGSGFMVSNSFTAVKEFPVGCISCPGDCRNCSLCKQARGLDIKVRYH